MVKNTYIWRFEEIGVKKKKSKFITLELSLTKKKYSVWIFVVDGVGAKCG